MNSKLTPPPTPEEVTTATRIIERHQKAHSNWLAGPQQWALDALIETLRNANNLAHMSELYGQLFEIDQNLDRLCVNASLPPDLGVAMPGWYRDAAALIVAFDERKQHLAALERIAGSPASPDVQHRYCKVERCVVLAYTAITSLGYQGEPITDRELQELNNKMAATDAFAELEQVVDAMEHQMQAEKIAESLSQTLGTDVSVKVVRVGEAPDTHHASKESSHGTKH